jgi:uncharacterized protein with HEPN domain
VSRSDEQRIADILDAAAELAEIAARGEADFMRDPILQRAAERLLEIIGEAATALSTHTVDATADVPWSDIRRLRIVLAHHYHRIDPAQVWTIAANDVPELAAALKALD